MKKLIPIFVAAGLALGGCASGGAGGGDAAPGYSDKDAASAIMAAEHEQKRAKAKGYEWRDTQKLIDSAKAAVKDGKFDEAVNLANKAKRQSTNAIAQADSQQNAGPRF